MLDRAAWKYRATYRRLLIIVVHATRAFTLKFERDVRSLNLRPLFWWLVISKLRNCLDVYCRFRPFSHAPLFVMYSYVRYFHMDQNLCTKEHALTYAPAAKRSDHMSFCLTTNNN